MAEKRFINGNLHIYNAENMPETHELTTRPTVTRGAHAAGPSVRLCATVSAWWRLISQPQRRKDHPLIHGSMDRGWDIDPWPMDRGWDWCPNVSHHPTGDSSSPTDIAGLVMFLTNPQISGHRIPTPDGSNRWRTPRRRLWDIAQTCDTFQIMFL